jgi:hypothetical protein
MARIAELEALVERLQSAAGAHEVLRSIYAHVNQPTGHRLKAAGLAIQHEAPKIQSVTPAIDATCEEISEPLAVVVDTQRARADRMQREARNIQVLPSGQVLLLEPNGNGGNGSDDLY